MENSTVIGKGNRYIKIPNTFNIRDLGGYPTAYDGMQTKWGKYFRGDSLNKVSKTDHAFIREKGIDLVVDLRDPSEGPYEIERSSKVLYDNITLYGFNDEKSGIPNSLTELYYNILDNKKTTIYKIMKRFIDNVNNGVLFHCTVGKDRTGVLAALLLDLVGVPHNFILQDYMLTEKSVNDIRLQNEKGKDESFTNVNVKDEFWQCKLTNMEAFLKYLNENYVNSERYLINIGLLPSEIEELKSSFLEKSI